MGKVQGEKVCFGWERSLQLDSNLPEVRRRLCADFRRVWMKPTLLQSKDISFYLFFEIFYHLWGTCAVVFGVAPKPRLVSLAFGMPPEGDGWQGFCRLWESGM